MILFKLWIDDTFIGSCSTDCTTDVSRSCPCVCDGRFHNLPTASVVYDLLSNPGRLIDHLATKHQGKPVRIEIDEHALFDYLMANAKVRTLTRIRGDHRA